VTDDTLEALRYPRGRFAPLNAVSLEERGAFIDTLAALPEQMRAAVDGLDDAQLDTQYRPEGWTLRQVVHHVPDSHLNSYIRFKWTLTEERPTIKTYDEQAWAELPEARTGPIGPSLGLLDALHGRWVPFLRTMSDADWARTLHHPEMDRSLSLDFMLQLYAWHSSHHLAHITDTRTRNGW